MKKLLLILTVAVAVVGCKKDDSPSVSVFELQGVKVGDEIYSGGYTFRIDTIYSAFKLFDFKKNGKDGIYVLKTSIYCEHLNYRNGINRIDTITYSCYENEIKINYPNKEGTYKLFDNYFIVDDGLAFNGKYKIK